jgi:hypothetical protein
MKKLYKRYGNMKMHSLLLLALFLACTVTLNGFAQMTVISGGKVVISSGGYLNSSENLVINNGGNVDVQGTLILKKNLQNNNVSTNSLGAGTVLFNGSVSQVITGLSIINNLTLNNASGLSIANNTRVNGILSLTSGRISLGGANLHLGPIATIGGAPSSTNMIVATGAGQLRKEFTGVGTFLFPVGDATGTAEYSPVSVGFNSAVFGLNNYVGVNLVDAAYPGVATSYLTRYWNLSQSAITNFSSNVSFQYLLADVVGTEANIFSTMVDPVLPWIVYNASNVGLHTIDAHGLGSFGTFTGTLGNAAVPPAIRSLQDKIIAPGMVKCADAQQTLIIGGNGTYYWVQNGGSVTHIAGVNIIYQPGTRVDAGGYLHGYISTTFCAPYNHPTPPPVVSGLGDPENSNSIVSSGSMFRIYPNPTTGKFTLELKGEIDPATVNVEIMSVLGDRIQTTKSLGSVKQEFSLSDRPTGIYMVHVTTPSGMQTQKIIKN